MMNLKWKKQALNPWISCNHIIPKGERIETDDNLLSRLWSVMQEIVRPYPTASPVYWSDLLRVNSEAARLGIRVPVLWTPNEDVMEPAEVESRRRLFDLILQTPCLDWLLPSNQPENFSRYLPWIIEDSDPYPNVWLGVRVESRNQAFHRIPILQQTPAALRFISAEPLVEDLGILSLREIHWVLCGGETGRTARPMDVHWAMHIHEQCLTQRVTFYMKQLGRKPTVDGIAIQSSSGDGIKLKEMPRSLRVRNLPQPKSALARIW
jgi:hypothetical protein